MESTKITVEELIESAARMKDEPAFKRLMGEIDKRIVSLLKDVIDMGPNEDNCEARTWFMRGEAEAFDYVKRLVSIIDRERDR